LSAPLHPASSAATRNVARTLKFLITLVDPNPVHSMA
jgi:hypothetical protein